MEWRHLARRFPQAVVVELAVYHETVDAVYEDTQATLNAYGKAEPISPWGWADPLIIDRRIVGVEKRPLAPVRSRDPSNVLIAALQLWVLQGGWAFAPVDARVGSGDTYVLLAMIDRLVNRKCRLSERAAADLCKFALPPPWTPDHDSCDLYLFPILRFLARSFSHPVPIALREALEDLSRRLLENEAMAKKRKTRGGLTPGRMRRARGLVLTLLGCALP